MEILNISAEHIENIAVIECHGALKRAHEELLLNLMENSYVQGAEAVLFDWSKITYFDTMGLECLISLHKTSVKHHGGLLAVLITDKVLTRAYKTLRFDSIIPLFANKNKALKSLQNRITQKKISKKLRTG